MTPALRVDWCSHAAAAYAVTHWHYSARMPVGKVVKLGAWEDDRFVGAVLYSWGANHNLSKPFDLGMTEVAELVRVALTDHEAPVSQIVAESLRLLRQQSPGLRLVVSFADPFHGHHGGIYQAGNWIYTGQTSPKIEYRVGRTVLNRRAYTGRQFGGAEGGGSQRAALPPGATPVVMPGKYRYLMPLDRAMRRRVARLALPFPQRGQGLDGEPPADQAGGPGSTPGDRSDHP